MTELARYDWGKRDNGEWDILPFTDGDYVKHADVAHLEQQAARLANLPGLPGWISGKWTIDGTYIYGEDATYGRVMFAYCADYDTAEALLALLNACYPPAPGQQIT